MWHLYSCVTLMLYYLLVVFVMPVKFQVLFKIFSDILYFLMVQQQYGIYCHLRFAHFFVTGFHCIDVAGPEHNMLTRLASNSQ